MKLKELLKNINHTMIGCDDAEITSIQYDSRKVTEGSLFFCIIGFNADGHKFAASAAEKGAACLVVSKPQDLDIPQVVVEDTREAMALISANFYGCPADKLRMVAVTGTNGKTSTTYMLKKIFEQAGSKVGLIGTIESIVGEKRVQSERTTPESMDLQKMLRDMLDAGCDTVVMEVSSHSLVLKRVYGIRFAGAIFTNLTQDHLDFHTDMDDYANAKAILFENSDHSVINADDAYAEVMKSRVTGELTTFAIDAPADYNEKDVSLMPNASRYVLASRDFRIPIVMAIPGRFTVYNSLGTAVLCLKLGIDLLDVKKGLENVDNVPGRFQNLDTHGQPFSVILDYCHTPDSLESTLKTVRGFAKGRIVCVFGCGGNRDNKKRPIMGRISGELADFTIVTSDNPRFEEPDSIIEMILEGISETDGNYISIENRRDAIEYALKNAEKDDVIVLAGKGHEDYQEICGVKHPFDEKVIVAEIMDALYPIK
ncbi:MAG: UDP-N-acetylmuramoyl-L-alanyl-D-glutamate--2,6-diaminopimelate ligase [Christensenellaceae bacterium]|nr:UDP-N-acetylmuramoyl-L-alanyl-D-glutamate--2,6-diaminopimelate ligase [Christensenellaceae bacterium]